MAKQSSPFVTESSFKREIKTLHQKIETSVEQLDKKIDTSVERLALAIMDNQERLTKVEQNMATKNYIDRVLNQVSDLAKKTDLVLQNQEIHRGYIHDHELRIVTLDQSPIDRRHPN